MSARYDHRTLVLLPAIGHPIPRAIGLIVALILVVGVTAALPGAARADGDPASDVLAAQDVFLPADAGVTTEQQARLAGVVAAATHRGVPIRVAVIGSPSDLGSIAALWRRPTAYAQFLDEELSLMFGGQVLVAMPDGFGLAHAGAHEAAERVALARLPAPGAGLVAAATRAVQELAAASGDPIAAPGRGSPAPAAAAAAKSGSAAVPGMVLGVGAALVLGCWGLSLRRRPPALPHRGSRGITR